MGILDKWENQADNAQLEAGDTVSVSISYVCVPLFGGYSNEEIRAALSDNPWYSVNSVGFTASSLAPSYWSASVEVSILQTITVSGLRALVKQGLEAMNSKSTIGCASISVSDVSKNLGFDPTKGGIMLAVAFVVVVAIWGLAVIHKETL